MASLTRRWFPANEAVDPFSRPRTTLGGGRGSVLGPRPAARPHPTRKHCVPSAASAAGWRHGRTSLPQRGAVFLVNSLRVKFDGRALSRLQRAGGRVPELARAGKELNQWPHGALLRLVETTKGLLKQPADRGKHPLDLALGCAALSSGLSYDSGVGSSTKSTARTEVAPGCRRGRLLE
jgi:hypothetical protein